MTFQLKPDTTELSFDGGVRLQADKFLRGCGGLLDNVSLDTTGIRINPATAAVVLTGTQSGYGISAGMPGRALRR